MRFTSVVILMIAVLGLSAQSQHPLQWTVDLRASRSQGPAVHSFAHGVFDSLVVIVGGRKDGLHRRQPSVSFAPEANNTDVIVVDPASGAAWRRTVLDLDDDVADHLQSTNQLFYSIDGKLVVIGGYGYSRSLRDHITFPRITVLDLRGVVAAAVAGTSIEPYVSTVTSEVAAVTGGYVARFSDTILLVAGQRFDGRYSPMGMGGGAFRQAYSDAIVRIDVNHSATPPTVYLRSKLQNLDLLHRRDFTMMPQLLADGTYGYMLYAGVFQRTANLPFLAPLEIRREGIRRVDGFEQRLNHYHGAALAAVDVQRSESYSWFFGGMAQFVPSLNGELRRDDAVPFVRTIGLVHRRADGRMQEYQERSSMPGLEGSGAAFIPRPDIATRDYGMIVLDSISVDSMLVGWILGGIVSEAENIFFVNDGTQSRASSNLYEVWLVRQTSTSIGQAYRQAEQPSNVSVTTSGGSVVVRVRSATGSQRIAVNVYTLLGQHIAEVTGTPSSMESLRVSIPPPSHLTPVVVVVRDGSHVESRLVVMSE